MRLVEIGRRFLDLVDPVLHSVQMLSRPIGHLPTSRALANAHPTIVLASNLGGNMDDERRIEAVKGIIASLFASQRSLRALAPDYAWRGLGNLLGDFGEFIAQTHYGLTKASAVADGFDARTADGQTVQVKTNHAATQIGFRGEADLLLVIHVRDNGEWEEVYYGPFAPVKAASRYSARDNKSMIAIQKLKVMKEIAPAGGTPVFPTAVPALPTK